jgi:hypothetical protein
MEFGWRCYCNSELALFVVLSPSILATSVGFSLLMGLIGGFLPALAQRLDYHSGLTGGIANEER